MMEALEGLSREIEAQGGRLHVYYGDLADVLAELGRDSSVKAIVFNKDYTPFSIERDEGINSFCKSKGLVCESYHDITLQKDFLEITRDNQPLLSFEEYHKIALSKEVSRPEENQAMSWATLDANKYFLNDFGQFCLQNKFYVHNPKLKCAVNRKSFFETFKENAKNLVSGELSSVLRWGVISPREIYQIYSDLKLTDAVICRNLFYRDFNFYVANYWPQLFQGEPLPAQNQSKREEWEYEEEYLDKWKDGMTGYPLVDAAMRKLKAIGFVEHKLRFITGLFLVRELNLDWRDGEKHYSNVLVDIDWTLNVFNWVQLGALRIDNNEYKHNFNFWNSQRLFDPHCLFIKEWVPELRDVHVEDIHNWRECCQKYPELGYPAPIVSDYDPESQALKIKQTENEKRIKQFLFN
jgi:deoxyribodipyrimidine photo-lyase